MPTLGAIVVSYHAHEDLVRFLSAWEQHNEMGAELTIAHVEYDESEWLNWVPYPEIGFKTNVGYGIACSTSVVQFEKDDIDTYALFNADTAIGPGTLDLCMSTLWSDPSYGVVGPLQANRRGQITHAGIFNVERPTHRGWQEMDIGKYRDVRDDCITVSGSAYFIKRSVWEQLQDCEIYRECFPDHEGAFPPMPFYYEETACSYHARAHGYKVVYDGRAPMIHEWNSSAGRNPYYAMQCMRQSRERFRAFCTAHQIRNEWSDNAG